jgi:hypothetical protein
MSIRLYNNSGGYIDLSAAGGASTANTFTIPSVVPTFFVTKSADQSGIADSTETVITFDTERFDVGSVWNTSTNRIEVTTETAGYYFLSGTLFCNCTNTIEDAYVRLRKNGTTFVELYNASVVQSAAASATVVTVSFSTVVNLTNSGDYADMTIFFDVSSGGTVNANQIDSTRSRTHLSGFRISV